MSVISQATQQVNLPFFEEARTGILPAQSLRAAAAQGVIQSENDVLPEQIQPASIDLRLGGTAFRVPASFLPGPEMTVRDKLRILSEETIDIEDGAILHTDHVYIVPLQEHLRLRRRMSGVANPKSSTGRLDVFARVITDFGTEFDTVPDKYVGPLWLEIAPRSFNVMVRRGSRLAQLRLRAGSPRSSDTQVRELNEEARIVRYEGTPNIKHSGLALSVDVLGEPISTVVGYRARKTDAPIDIDKVNFYEPDDFWERIVRPEQGGLVLQRDQFYILATKETVAVPHDVAADMVAYDTLVGEFRVHYAGFFDPGFGYSAADAPGAKIVLEVRSHEVPFMIEHGQIVGRVMLEQLTEKTDTPYGLGIGSSYHAQALTLGKQFKR
ncbi:MAG: 2'-deoxycytidine 5'-triphosphate deaminase [Alphaproteobacteria bacterium]|nr:2'-deoxycytidine 5'-triphosphate deaminase [Alphaproteobacteria bacterium]